MNGLEPLGKWLMLTGVVFVVIGGLLWLLSRFDLLGSLPGDIRIEGEGFTCLIPLASSLLLSILLTIVLNVIIRLLNR
jgi:hypothetical protein